MAHMRQEWDILQHRVGDQSRRISTLAGHHDALAAENEQLRAEQRQAADDEDERFQELRSVLDDALDEIETLRGGEPGQNPSSCLDDQTAMASWKRLSYCIKSMASKYFRQPISTSDVAKHHSRALRDKFRAYDLDVGSQIDSVLVQAFTWRILYFHVFRHPCTAWNAALGAVTKGRVVADFESSMDQDKIKAYHQWRSTSAQTFQNNLSINQRKIDNLSDWLADLTIPLAVSDLDSDRAGDMEDAIHDIVCKATDLAVLFVQAKASFEAVGLLSSRRGRRLVLDSGWMEPVRGGDAEDKAEGDRVKLIVAPALVKAGNSDGEDYDQRAVLVKARVQ